MKKILWTLAGLIALTSCGNSDKQYISEAEALISEKPDSALYVLNQVENVGRLPDEWLARYWLTTAEAHAAMNQSLSEDSMVAFAFSYFQHHQPIDSVRLRKARSFTSSYYWWTEREDEAKKLMVQSLEESRKAANHPETVSMLCGMAKLALKNNNQKEAKQYVDELLSIDGGDKNHAQLLNALAVNYYYEGKIDSAIVMFKRAIAFRDTAKDSVYVWRDAMRNYADLLIDIGRIDEGIAMHEDIMAHYGRSKEYSGNELGPLFSLSHAWLLKGNKERAQHYMNKVEEYDMSNSTRFCVIGHRMVLDYATTGRYNITDMAEFANDIRNRMNKRQAVEKAKERSIQNLREHELLLTVSRQRQLIFFLLLTIGLLAVIIALSVLARRRKRLLREKEEEMQQLNDQLQKMQKMAEQRAKMAEAAKKAEDAPAAESTVTLTGTTSETITLNVDNLLYVEAVGNYVKVCQWLGGKVQTDMLRATSKQMEEELHGYPMVVRCHRAFLVNLAQVEKIVSKAGTMQLLVRHSEECLPVSRSNMAGIKDAIKSL